MLTVRFQFIRPVEYYEMHLERMHSKRVSVMEQQFEESNIKLVKRKSNMES